MIVLLAVLAAQVADPAPAVPGDVPAVQETAWTACRNEKGNFSFKDEVEGCEALIAADGVDNEIKAVAHANRGMLMSQVSFFATAKDDLDTAIRLNPKLAPAYYNRALLMEATGEPEAAIADYTAAISILPTMVEAYINRGIARAKSGQPELALADFNQAIELQPGSADIYENRAILLRDMGRTKEAEADEAKAKELAK